MSTDPPLRRIAHLDMDAFYASVELLRYPQLKGLSVVIGGSRRRGVSFDTDALALARAHQPEREWGSADLGRIPVELFPRLSGYTGRGVITTATYAARQFGVGSAMGLMKAAKLCPDAILLPVDFDEYRRFSREFKAVITDIAPVMEDRGVDEALHRLHYRARRSARRRACAGATDTEKHFRSHRPHLLGGRGPQQAAGQNGQRAQQAQWHCHRP